MWSQVLRSAITDENLLGLCGFEKRSGGPRTGEAIASTMEKVPPATPVGQHRRATKRRA